MSTLPEQFSAVRKSQVEAQISFFQNYSEKSLESVQKIFALNMSLTRASLEKSSAVFTQLFSVKDPRDLLALTNNSQENFNGLLAYGRELMAITAGAAVTALPETAAAAPVAVQSVPAEAAPVVVVEAETVVAAAPASVAAAPEALPVEEKPIAKAVAKAASKPVAAPVPPADAPVDIAQQQLDLPPAKSRKKK